MGHVTFHLSGFPCLATQSAKETAGTWDVPVSREWLWLLQWLMKKGWSHSLSMLVGGQDGPDRKGVLFCAHSNCQAPPARLLHYHSAAPRNLPGGFFQGHVNAPQEAQMPCPSQFTKWFLFLTRQMPLGAKGLCHIARSHLTSHGREQPTRR